MSDTEDTPPPDPAAGILEAIRADSRETRLSRLSALKARFPDLDPAALVAESGAEDLKKMAGARGETYYFSALSMTEAYALHLFRVEEKDPVALVRDTVRDESRIYPRPTDIRVFLDPPFSLTERELEDTLGRMSLRPDCADILSCEASTGARFLFSRDHLAEPLARSLAEWVEVGQKDNP